MIKKGPDLSWLPPREEWDFRSITEEECRVACDWEYKRERPNDYITNDTAPLPSSGKDFEPFLRRPMRDQRPKPWLCLTDSERATAIATRSPSPSVQVRTFREFMHRAPVGWRQNVEAWNCYTNGVYTIRPNFKKGVGHVIAALERWARSEAKKFDKAPRAKAAAPPFHLLRWLAVYRIDQCAKKAGIKYRQIEEALEEYRKKHRCKSAGDVFPGGYGSHGAWSKACRDAERAVQTALKDSGTNRIIPKKE